jgi:hypothetical protein
MAYYVPNNLDPSGLNVSIEKRGPYCNEDGNVYLALVITGLGKDEGLYGQISIKGSYFHYKTLATTQINKSIYVYNHAGPSEETGGGTWMVKKDKADEYNRLNWIVLIHSEINCKCSVTTDSVKASFSYRVVKENNPGRFGWNRGGPVTPNFWFWNQVSHGMTRSSTPPELYSPYKRDSVEIDVTWDNPGPNDHLIDDTSNNGQGGEVPDSPWTRPGR